MKAYIITTLNYEYNDEEMYREGGVALDDKKIHFDRNAAIERYQELEISTLRSVTNSFYEYYYNNSDADCAEVAKIFTDSGIDSKSWTEDEIKELDALPSALTDEQVLDVAELLEVNFYELEELDVDPVEMRSELSKIAAVGRKPPKKKEENYWDTKLKEPQRNPPVLITGTGTVVTDDMGSVREAMETCDGDTEAW